MNIDKDMLKHIENGQFIFNKHDMYLEDEIKTHWDIRIAGEKTEWSLIDDPTKVDSVLAIERQLRPEPTSIPNTVVQVDEGAVNLLETHEGKTVVFGGKDLHGTWIIVQDDECIIPGSVKFVKSS